MSEKSMSFKEMIERVKEFHHFSNQKIAENFDLEDEKTLKLRANLIKEESIETQRGLENKNLEEILDGLCDLQYVLIGTLISLGLDKIFEEAFEEVCESNLSKFTKDSQEAYLSKEYYWEANMPCRVEEKGGRFIIIRNCDGKILKPKGTYRPPNLSKFL